MRGAVIVLTLWSAAALGTEAPIAITCATVIDRRDFGRSAVDRRNTVLVDDGRIAAVGRRVRVPPNARRVDGKGLFLVPVYIDGFSAQANQSFANAHLYMG